MRLINIPSLQDCERIRTRSSASGALTRYVSWLCCVTNCPQNYWLEIIITVSVDQEPRNSLAGWALA